MGTPTIDTSSLRQACFGIAQTTSWQYQDSVASSLDSVTPKANAYYAIALRFANELAERGVDPNLAVGAMHQMSIHAIPPMGDDVRWMEEKLDVFAELLAPCAGLNSESRKFLTALRDAIDENLREDQA
jgi:hypothetical protein